MTAHTDNRSSPAPSASGSPTWARCSSRASRSKSRAGTPATSSTRWSLRARSPRRGRRWPASARPSFDALWSGRSRTAPLLAPFPGGRPSSASCGVLEPWQRRPFPRRCQTFPRAHSRRYPLAFPWTSPLIPGYLDTLTTITYGLISGAQSCGPAGAPL